MTIIKWIVIVLSVLNAGYMTFDGARALIKGDYIRPTSGEYAGQLGPWAGLVKKIGIEPESTLMKTIFVVFGIVLLGITACFAMNMPWAAKALLAGNILALWYLWTGTISSAIQIILLIILLL